MKLAPLCLALGAAGMAAPVWAAQVQGTITDEQGNPIVGVEIQSAQKRIYTDQQGRYQLTVADNQHLHLHFGAGAFVHQERDLDLTTGTTTLNLVLRASNIENITVTGTALGRSVLESATPVTVLADDKLLRATEPTLGETLAREPGVQSSYFGPVASRPIIRGMDGPRVKVLQNGLSVSDASTLSADHSVTAEAGTARQIEILRGPGTLLYGNGAIGGVVNVVDDRIAQHPVEALSGNVDARYGTGADERTVSGSLNGGNGALAFHLDGNRRRTHDVDIPGYGEQNPDEPQPYGKLDNSDIKQDDATAGLSYTGERGFIGVSANRLESNYGIVGHEHEHDEEEEEGEHEEEGHQGVRIDLKKTHYQLLAGLNDPLAGFSRLSFAAAYTDYQHQELEEGLAATTFKNKASEARLSLYHKPLAEWQGVIGLHGSHRDFSATGEEAITPSSKTDSLAAFLVEERQFGNLNLELGARVEHYQIKADTIILEGHDGDELFSPEKQSDTNLSLSAGSVWEYRPGYTLGLALTHAERSATAEELYSYGPHLATGTFEVGALYHLHGDHAHPEDGSLSQEKANNLDLTLRKFEGDWSWSLNLFYNEVDNYFYQRNTGTLVGEDEEEGAEEEEEHHHHGEGLPIYQYSQADARLYGFEAALNIPLGRDWSIDAFGDYTRGKLKDGGNLPRISPLRLGLTLNYDWQDWHGELGAVRYARQDKVADFESESAGYTLVDASVSYRYFTTAGDVLFYLKGTNLTDREARPHTSFLKDKAPLPGRNLTLGVRYAF